MDIELHEALKKAIMKALESDPRAMSMNFLMNRTFKDLQSSQYSNYVTHKSFVQALNELLEKCWVGRTKSNKYFMDYLDYEESDVSGEGYITIDAFSGHGQITIKKNHREYTRPSHFVHKKNINGAKHGDYVRYVELLTNKSKTQSLKDATVKDILPKPKLEM